MLTYATYNDFFTRLKTADEAASPGAHGHPGWLPAVMGGVMRAIAGGWLPPGSTAAGFTAALAADVNGYVAWIVRGELVATMGKSLGNALAARAMAAIGKMAADDAFVAQLQQTD